MRTVSIIMTYHNRPDQLRQTLISFQAFYGVNLPDIQVVIVDDGSSPHQKAKPIVEQLGISASVIEISSKEKNWTNPCIPFNMGFRVAEGEIVVIQNAECVHLDNILNTVRSQLNDSNYLVFPAYSTTQEELHQILRLHEVPEFKPHNWYSSVLQRIQPLKSDRWYHHPQYNPTWYHFCSAITRKNLMQLGGFNEAFAQGYCFEDNEFVFRIRKSGLKFPLIHENQGWVAHLWHPKNPGLHGGCELWERNRTLYNRILGGGS